MTGDDLLRRAVAMAEPERRASVARAIAAHFGASDLIVFVRDAVIGRSLPAAGFPQTLRNGRAWRALLDCATAEGEAIGDVLATDGQPATARGVGVAGGTVAVLVGTTDTDTDLTLIRTVLPLFGSFFQVESVALRAATRRSWRGSRRPCRPN